VSAVTVWHLVVYVPLCFPVAAALAARPLAEHLEPRFATWLLTASALALAALSWTALGVLAAAGVVRLPLAALVGGWSISTVRAGDPVSTAEAVVAGVVLAAAVVAGVRMLWRRVRALAAAAFEAACLPGHGQMVVVDDPAPDAYALPGLPGRVVVSTGMLDALDDADREAMLAHERAHLTCHHYAFVAAAQLAATCNPLLRPVATAVAYTIERWADERARARAATAARSPAPSARLPWQPRTAPPAGGCPAQFLVCSAAAATHWPPPDRSPAVSPRCWPNHGCTRCR
jgi:Zn-dependent protease with chaperone function